MEWFSEKLQRSWAEWLFAKKDLKRIIAPLELLATLVAVRLWTGNNGTSKGVCWVRAGTDNQSNTFAVSKMMSTKYPLTLLVSYGAFRDIAAEVMPAQLALDT